MHGHEDPFEANRATIVYGADFPQSSGIAARSISATLAVGTTAGSAVKWQQSLDPNEDVGAVVSGDRAQLLVVADAHFGCEAAELAVEYVLAALAHDPPPADETPERLAMLLFEAGIAVRQGTSLPTCPHPDSRTTLALALLGGDELQWATFGDSYVLVVEGGEVRRLDTPSSAYLGHVFELSEVASLMSHGRAPRGPDTVALVATDGIEALVPRFGEVARLVSDSRERGYGARLLVEDVLRLALEAETGDATTVALAL